MDTSPVPVGATASTEVTVLGINSTRIIVKNPTFPEEIDSNNNAVPTIPIKEITMPVIAEIEVTESPVEKSPQSPECSDCGSDTSGTGANGNTTPDFQTKAKELLTSYSRLHPQSCSVHLDSKLGSLFDRLSSLTQDSTKGFNLINFLVAGIVSNLKSLGVEEIDCKEHVEAWLSQRRQRRWTQSLGNQPLPIFRKDEHPNPFIPSCKQCLQNLNGSRKSAEGLSYSKSETFTVFNPSQPNSSILRLTGDGNVKLGQFLQRMEEVRSHFNNATCTVIQSTGMLALPYLKLLSGDQLDDLCCLNFTDQWLQIVTMMAQDLKTEPSKEVDMMLAREYRALQDESGKLLKRLRKLYQRLCKIWEDNERDAKPALQRLQPKCLPRFRGRRAAAENQTDPAQKAPVNTTLVPEPAASPLPKLQLSPVPLGRANVKMADLYKQHIFFAKSMRGFLVFKHEIQDEWRRFTELSFNNRRDLFLHVFDDLHGTLKAGYNIAGYVKELFIEGYPESVATKIQDNLKYIKEISKENDLLMLSKVAIANQIRSLNDSITRLVQTLKNAKDIAKHLAKNIKQSSKVAKSTGSKSLWKRKTANQFNSSTSSSRTRDSWECEFDVNLSLRFDNTKVKLLVPYPNSMNPFID